MAVGMGDPDVTTRFPSFWTRTHGRGTDAGDRVVQPGQFHAPRDGPVRLGSAVKEGPIPAPFTALPCESRFVPDLP